MKKSILASLLLLSCTIAYSQKSDSVKTKKLSIGLVFSGYNSYRTLHSDGSAIANSTIQGRDTTEIPAFRWSFGASGTFEPVKGLVLGAGLIYSARGYNTTSNTLTEASQGKIVKLGTNIFDYNYYYLDVPLMIGYEFQAGKFHFGVNGGLVVSLWLNSTTTSILTDTTGKTNSTTQSMDPVLRHGNFSLTANIAISYDITNNLYITLQPNYLVYIQPIVADVPVSEYLYSYGGSLGVYYRF